MRIINLYPLVFSLLFVCLKLNGQSCGCDVSTNYELVQCDDFVFSSSGPVPLIPRNNWELYNLFPFSPDMVNPTNGDLNIRDGAGGFNTRWAKYDLGSQSSGIYNLSYEIWGLSPEDGSAIVRLFRNYDDELGAYYIEFFALGSFQGQANIYELINNDPNLVQTLNYNVGVGTDVAPLVVEQTINLDNNTVTLIVAGEQAVFDYSTGSTILQGVGFEADRPFSSGSFDYNLDKICFSERIPDAVDFEVTIVDEICDPEVVNDVLVQTVRVWNLGNITSPPTQASLFVSTASSVGSLNYNQSYLSTESVSAIPAGQFQDVSFLINVCDEGISPGNYGLGITVDPNQNIDELDDTFSGNTTYCSPPSLIVENCDNCTNEVECIDNNCADLSFDYVGNNGVLTYDFSTNNPFLGDDEFCRWEITQFNEVLVAENFNEQFTYTFDNVGDYEVCYYWWDESSNCLEKCCKNIVVEDPYLCGEDVIDFEYLQGSNAFQFTLNGVSPSSIEWINDDTGQVVSLGSSYTISAVGTCSVLNLSVRYFLNGQWYICCISVFVCPPGTCANNIESVWNTDLSLFELTLSTSLVDESSIIWENDTNPGCIIENGSFTVPYTCNDGCVEETICVTYLDESSGCWYVCCRVVDFCPPNCERELCSEIDDNCNTVNYTFLGEQEIGSSGGTIIYELSPGQSFSGGDEFCSWEVVATNGSNGELTSSDPIFIVDYSSESLGGIAGEDNRFDFCYYWWDLSEDCLKKCCKTVDTSFPFWCIEGDIHQMYDASSESYIFQLDGNYQNITWFNDDTDDVIGQGASITLPIPENCGIYNLCAQYYDPIAGCWYMCCRAVYLCNPLDCSDNIEYEYNVLAQQHELTLTDPFALVGSIVWQNDTYPDCNIPDGQTMVIPDCVLPCTQQTISVTYYDSNSGCWYTCCKVINPNCGIEICGNGIDDDMDGQIDCADEDCEGSECCPEDVCCTDDPLSLPWLQDRMAICELLCDASFYCCTFQGQRVIHEFNDCLTDGGGTVYDCSGNEIFFWGGIAGINLDLYTQLSDCQLLYECGEEICDNGLDDDMDGLIDCADPDCSSNTSCTEFCCTDNPLSLPWLQSQIQNCSSTSCGLIVSCCTYQGQKVINVANDLSACTDGGGDVFDCSGNLLFTWGTIAGINYDLLAQLIDCTILYECGTEICNNGLDDDSDGLIDENDPDCTPSADCSNGEGCCTNDPFSLLWLQNIINTCNESDCLLEVYCCSYQGQPVINVTTNPNECEEIEGTVFDCTGEVVFAWRTGDIETRFALDQYLQLEGCELLYQCGEEICDNGVDDDGDGLIDCNDPDCTSSGPCIDYCCTDAPLSLPWIVDIITECGSDEPCTDVTIYCCTYLGEKVINVAYDLSSCADEAGAVYDCSGLLLFSYGGWPFINADQYNLLIGCQEIYRCGEEICSNGIDDDNDGLTDCDDPDCTEYAVCEALCCTDDPLSMPWLQNITIGCDEEPCGALIYCCDYQGQKVINIMDDPSICDNFSGVVYDCSGDELFLWAANTGLNMELYGQLQGCQLLFECPPSSCGEIVCETDDNCTSIEWEYIGEGDELVYAFEHTIGLDEGDEFCRWEIVNETGNIVETSFLESFTSALIPGIYNICCYWWDASAECLKVCCINIYVDLPVNCEEVIDYEWDRLMQQYVFTLNMPGVLPATIQWQNDTDPTCELMDGLLSTAYDCLLPCDEQTISVRYFDPISGCWYICCRTIYLCAPQDCENVIDFMLVSGIEQGELSLNVDGVNPVGVSWQNDTSPECDIIDEQVTVPLNCVLPCEEQVISVKYFDPVTSCWYLCCKTIFPCLADEICDNNIDDDGDGLTDCEDPDCTTFCNDMDGDGYSSTVDCDDDNPDINPGAEDIPGNGIDENCDNIDGEVNNLELTFVAGGHQELTGTTGSQIVIPITVEQFDNIQGFQFTVSLLEEHVGSIIQVESTGALNAVFTQTVNTQQEIVLWDSGNGTSVSLPDGTIILNVVVELNGTGEECSVLSITDDVADLFAISSDNPEFIPNTITGAFCILSTVRMTGVIRNELDSPINEVTVSCTNSSDQITGLDGAFDFSGLLLGDNIEIRPSKNGNLLNGVNVADIVLIRAHILTLDTLDSPYKLIAADVNKSGAVNVGDIVNIRQLILTQTQTFGGGNTSWRFVPEAYEFINPTNPVVEEFPESLIFNNANQDELDANFVAIKTGDVNNSADTNQLTDDNVTQLFFDMPRELKAGETFEVKIWPSACNTLAGLQLQLQFDEQIAEFDRIIVSDNTYEMWEWSASGSILNLLWYDHTVGGQRLSCQASHPLRLIFRAKQKATEAELNLHLNNEQSLSSDFRGQLSSIAMVHNDVQLTSSTQNLADDTTILTIKQCFPNPFLDNCLLYIDAQARAQVKVSVINILGDKVWHKQVEVYPGQNSLLISRNDLPAAGTYLIYVQSSTDIFTQKIIVNP